MSKFTRRQFLIFFGSGAAAVTLTPKVESRLFGTNGSVAQAQTAGSITPVKLPSPLSAYTQMGSAVPTGGNGSTVPTGMGMLSPGQELNLASYEVFDDVVVPPEFERYVIVSWGDRVFPDSSDYVGYNNDYTSFIPISTAFDDGYLWINHEYVSFPISPVAPGTSEDLQGAASSAPAVIGVDLSAPTLDTFGEFLYNLGGSIIRITKGADGRFAVVAGDSLNRRIHGLSGLGINAERSDGFQGVTSWGSRQGDQNFLQGTGPAATEVFPLSSDGLGNRIIGTAYNCSGGTTPWGTILTAEENFQGSADFFVGVQEQVLPNGTQTGYVEGTTGSLFGLVGEKYGWMVEIAPTNPGFRPSKHTNLGRFRHENIAFRIETGRQLVAYMGDDRRGGHTWKYVSSGVVESPTSSANSSLFELGTLYVAKLNEDGTGEWIPLTLQTPTNPNVPSEIASRELQFRGEAGRDGRVRLPKRAGVAGETEDGGSLVVDLTNEATAIPDYEGRTLADFYSSQGAVLVDSFLAANLVGGTPTARPEDLEVNPSTGEVFIAYTDSEPGGDGYPDSRIFIVSKFLSDVSAPQSSGGLFKLTETNNDPAALTFTWTTSNQGGEGGSLGGSGFANVDNLEFDSQGNVWGVTDMSTSRHNGFTTGANPEAREIDHTTTGSASNLVGVFGNNWLFYIPMSGSMAGEVIPFAYGPVRCEMTGPYFIPSPNGGDDTLLLAVQHPGEDVPVGDGTKLSRSIEMLGLDGALFSQERIVPLGSNWPSNIQGDPNGVPKPAVIGVRRIGGGSFI
ncbi:MAG: alkaline phosphatase PhoX [Cyanobacteria bacterium J06592_8]